jgi:RNA polymerase sigma-70 factor (ECF subfamily)
MTDRMIVDLFFSRDESAIRECDTKYGPPLRSFGNRITNDTGITEECLDDTYMSAWSTIPPKDPGNYLFAFLSKLMRGKCVDSLRKKTREKRGGNASEISAELCDGLPSDDNTEQPAIASELARLIEKFLAGERDEVRHIFVLRYFYMYEVRDIAKRLFITEGKVKTVLKRSRDKLRTFLSLYGYGGDI